MGLLVSAEDNQEPYDKVVEEVLNLVEVSVEAEEEQPQAPQQAPPKGQRNDPWKGRRYGGGRRQQLPRSLPRDGFCIRCGGSIPFNISRPYCVPHYKSWERYKNPNYEEHYCHCCGATGLNPRPTLAKPLCRECYRKHKTALEMVAT